MAEVTLTPLPTTSTTITCPLDVIGVFPPNTHLRAVSQLLKDRLCIQLDYIKSLMVTNQDFTARYIPFIAFQQEDQLCSVTVHHFSVPSQHCPVTVVYPHTLLHSSCLLTDKDLTSTRRDLHKILFLPSNQPYLRLINLHWDHTPQGKQCVHINMI